MVQLLLRFWKPDSAQGRDLTAKLSRLTGWLPLAVVLLSWLPIFGLGLGRWVFTFTGPISTPMACMSGWLVFSALFGQGLLPRSTQRSYWMMTVCMAAFLVPMASGWGSVDPFVWGWDSQFIFLPAALAIVSLWLGQPVLALLWIVSAVAWQVDLLEYSNGWNYLIDPVATGASFLGLIHWGVGWVYRQSLRQKSTAQELAVEGVDPRQIIQQDASKQILARDKQAATLRRAG